MLLWFLLQPGRPTVVDVITVLRVICVCCCIQVPYQWVVMLYLYVMHVMYCVFSLDFC